MATNKWTNEFLDRMRSTGDVLADGAAEVLWKNPDCNIIEDLRTLNMNHEAELSDNVKGLYTYTYLTEKEQDVLESFFRTTGNIGDSFDDIDKAHFQMSSDIFDRYGYFITFHAWDLGSFDLRSK